MPVTLTIRDVPEDVRDLLSAAARRKGQSLQTFLLELLRREAAFDRNRDVLAEVLQDDQRDRRTGDDLQDVVELIHEARAERDTQIIRAIWPESEAQK